MIGQILLYISGLLTIIWGAAHLFPTKSVVQGFGNISQDNKNIITMEWLVEGVALIFIGILIVFITSIDPKTIISTVTYFSTAIFLFIMAIISFFTGFKVNFLPYKLCPVIFTFSALLIIIGWYTIK
jgi:uncharacterized membrane protein